MDDVVPLLKHNPTAQRPDVLEAITVQRQPLIADLVDAAHETGGGLRHRLLVGPRGSGKSHVVALVAHRVREAGAANVVLAQLLEDPWGIRTYGKLIAAIVGTVADELDDAPLAERAAELRAGGSASEGERLLREAVGERQLVVLIENLDDVFDRIGSDGQASLRAFAENWRQMLVLATTPQLFAGVRDHASPFYGFFRITHLDELTLDSAADLLRRIAAFRHDELLLRFLDSDRAMARLRAVEALAGGHPRVWLLLAGCVSVSAIDELVPLFLEALDELTPYYQDRLRVLGRQQQELVVLLGEAGGALANRDLAERSGLAQKMIASRMAELDELGYVRRAAVPDALSGGDKRMTYWELREPLMRLCLDVKQSRGKPLRIIVEFLRAWYGLRILDELARLPPDATLAARYATHAVDGLDVSGASLLIGTPRQIVARAEAGLRLRPGDRALALARAMGLSLAGGGADALADLQKAIEHAETRDLHFALSRLTVDAGDAAGSRTTVDQARAIVEDPSTGPLAIADAAETLDAAGFQAEAAAAVDRAIDLAPHEAVLLVRKANLLARGGDSDASIDLLEQAVGIEPEAPWVHAALASRLRHADRMDAALDVLRHALAIAPNDANLHHEFARLNVRTGTLEAGLQSAFEAARLDADEPRFHATVSQLLFLLDRAAEAVQPARRAVALAPSVARHHYDLASSLLVCGEYAAAAEAARAAIALDAAFSGFHVTLGSALWELEQHDDAFVAFQRVVELAPADATGWHLLATAYDSQGRLDEAADAVVRAAELAPERADIADLEASVRLRRRDFDAAIAAARRAATLAPDSVDHRRMLTRALVAAGRSEEALVQLDAALTLGPEDADLWDGRAIVLASLERPGEAVDAARRAVDLGPGRDRLERLARLLYQLDRYSDAVEILDQLVRHEECTAESHRLHAFSLSHLGRRDEALASLLAGLERFPDDASLHNSAADDLRAVGRLGDAEERARAAVALQPGKSIYRFTLAEIALVGGDDAKAVQRFHDALEVWKREPSEVPGEPTLVSEILWERRTGWAFASRLVKLYRDAGAAAALAAGVTAGVPHVVADDVSQETADQWLETWQRSAAGIEEFEVALAVLGAAVGWKADGDRAHLLALPAEQRAILVQLLDQSSAA